MIGVSAIAGPSDGTELTVQDCNLRNQPGTHRVTQVPGRL